MTKKLSENLPIAFPSNATTGKEYTEGNILRLLDTPFMDQRWATFKQWKDAGYKVIKGSKGTELIKVVTVKDKNDSKKTKSVPRRFYVFNIEQVEEIANQ
jgi:antirestriction protein ArdC